MIQVLVVGGTGMLGSMLVDVLSKNPDLRVRSTFNRTVLPSFPANVHQIMYASGRPPLGLRQTLRKRDWVINVAGHSKRRIVEEDPTSVRAAIEANALLPLELLDLSLDTGCSVLQISTDSVYSGLGVESGEYRECSLQDAVDVHGKTKSLGEVRGERFYHLRCSVIGPEPRPGVASLLEWFIAQPRNAEVAGFLNHRWNGVTTLAFAKIAEAIVAGRAPRLAHLQHIVPFDMVSQYVLFLELSRVFRRLDITVRPKDAMQSVDRTLSTNNPGLNEQLWRAAGYYGPPKICELIEQLAWHSYFFKRPNGGET